MRDPEAFDAFYAEARGRLLLQTYALTGDLPASRDAVRSAFVAAWHHWKKVSRHGDPEAWVRPEAWRRARRRHQARPWHREKVLDEEDPTTAWVASTRRPEDLALALRTAQQRARRAA